MSIFKAPRRRLDFANTIPHHQEEFLDDTTNLPRDNFRDLTNLYDQFYDQNNSRIVRYGVSFTWTGNDNDYNWYGKEVYYDLEGNRIGQDTYSVLNFVWPGTALSISDSMGSQSGVDLIKNYSGLIMLTGFQRSNDLGDVQSSTVFLNLKTGTYSIGLRWGERLYPNVDNNTNRMFNSPYYLNVNGQHYLFVFNQGFRSEPTKGTAHGWAKHAIDSNGAVTPVPEEFYRMDTYPYDYYPRIASPHNPKIWEGCGTNSNYFFLTSDNGGFTRFEKNTNTPSEVNSYPHILMVDKTDFLSIQKEFRVRGQGGSDAESASYSSQSRLYFKDDKLVFDEEDVWYLYDISDEVLSQPNTEEVSPYNIHPLAEFIRDSDETTPEVSRPFRLPFGSDSFSVFNSSECEYISHSGIWSLDSFIQGFDFNKFNDPDTIFTYIIGEDRLISHTLLVDPDSTDAHCIYPLFGLNLQNVNLPSTERYSDVVITIGFHNGPKDGELAIEYTHHENLLKVYRNFVSKVNLPVRSISAKQIGSQDAGIRIQSLTGDNQNKTIQIDGRFVNTYLTGDFHYVDKNGTCADATQLKNVNSSNVPRDKDLYYTVSTAGTAEFEVTVEYELSTAPNCVISESFTVHQPFINTGQEEVDFLRNYFYNEPITEVQVPVFSSQSNTSNSSSSDPCGCG